jgi:integrase
MTYEAMDNFVKYLNRKRLAGTSVQHYIRCVKIYLRAIGRPLDDYQYYVPSESKKALRRKKMERWFTEEEVEKCKGYNFPSYKAERLKERNRIVVRLLIDTAARVKEINNIRIKDFDFKTSPPQVRLWTSKTQPRWVPMSPETGGKVKKWIESSSLLPDSKPFNQRRLTYVNVMLSDLGLKKAGRGPHTFRHYAATMWYEKGLRIELIAHLMGDQVGTVQRCYLHPSKVHTGNNMAEILGWNSDSDDDLPT